ncbi:hypothetical protein P167DRAFT_100082 [Morchella conica CCBAS932]|uniref:Uncharacterized protein n=1 Tax=Morchella conica CCBAS932 TaxID=1392247 RepID=A0A3N4KB56_9PEZI|nr:hypothetical protein P167DRAFT_100082 [Morchella conica CCBAS932]
MYLSRLWGAYTFFISYGLVSWLGELRMHEWRLLFPTTVRSTPFLYFSPTIGAMTSLISCSPITREKPIERNRPSASEPATLCREQRHHPVNTPRESSTVNGSLPTPVEVVPPYVILRSSRHAFCRVGALSSGLGLRNQACKNTFSEVGGLNYLLEVPTISPLCLLLQPCGGADHVNEIGCTHS